MLTINNLDKIVRYPINNTFHVRCMICGHINYHISLTDGKGQHRDLKLNRMKGRRGMYRLTYGKFSVDLPFSELSNIHKFSSHIKRLLC